MSLNLSDFRTVFSDDFGNDQSLNGILWPVRWAGNPSQMSFSGGMLTLSATATSGPVGFMQAPIGKSAGEGYGLFQYTGYANANQGTGICFIMWRADNLVVDPAMPNVGTEIDVLESWDGTRTGESGVHFYSAGYVNPATGAKDNNAQFFHPLSINLTVSHTYAMDWERGSLTFYVDGNLIYQDTVHAPLDYADGGSNEVMGAEVVNAISPVQLHITNMSYSSANSVALPPATSTSVTLVDGQFYAAASGTSIQAVGNDTVTATAGGVNVAGGAGTLFFFGGTSSSAISGGIGSMTIFGGTGGGTYTGGTNGNNVFVSQGASGSNTTLTGGGAGDRLFGSASGNDTLVAKVGRESILGGGGNTEIIGGGTAASVIFTGSGVTNVYGGVAGGDIIVGGTGAMTVNAQKGDAIFGNTSASLTVNGSVNGPDSIIGGSGALTINGQGSNMFVVAGTSTSNINVSSGASVIFGSAGAATITGGAGYMEVIQGSGNMTIRQGTGPTVYDVVKGSAGGTDMLNGFNTTLDTIRLFGYAAADVHVTKGGGSTLISLSDGTKINLVGVADPGHSIVG